MTDFFDLPPEIPPKDKIISIFNDWWTDDEIRKDIIPSIADKRFSDSIYGQLQNYEKESHAERKSFAEILFDYVGKNFLVNTNKHTRTSFLCLIIKKQIEIDSSFKDIFLSCLISNINSESAGSCKKCNSKWNKDQPIFSQKLGLKKPLYCSDKECITAQQRIVSNNLCDLVKEFTINKEYKSFCKTIIEHLKAKNHDHLELPREIFFSQSHEAKLLPDTIRPIGMLQPLHDYQSSIRLKILDMLENYTIDTSRALVVLPTGAGKTRLVVETLIDWINDGKKGKEDKKFILWIVDKKELCQQAFDTFADMFRHKGKKDSSLRLHPIYDKEAKNIGDILYQHSGDDGGYIDEQNGVIVASIQSLYSISKNSDNGSLPELGKYTAMVIIDEAHHAVPSNISYNRVLEALGFNFRRRAGMDISENHTCLLGLTATPFRGDDDKKSTTSLLNRFGKKHRILWPSFSDLADEVDVPPHASLTVQKNGLQNEQIRLYGEGSYSITDERIIEYHFIILKHNHDSPSTEVYNEKGQDANIDFSFRDPGKYEIQLYVSDSKNTSTNMAISYINILQSPRSSEASNDKEMKKLYDHLIKQKILAVPHHYIIDYSRHKVDMTDKEIEQFKQFHDISEKTIKAIGSDPQRNHRIINKICSLINKENKKSILLFACSVEHSRFISFVLDALYGIKSASIDHKISTEERDEITNDFRQGKISVLCNYNILTTGFDSPKVDCVFVARPTFSHVLYNQMAGRGLRGPKNNGTTDCVIVDISDNIQLVSDKEEVDQSWRFFEYIYDTVYDERKSTDQTCYSCFGNSTQSLDCKICDGTGIISHKSKSSSVAQPKKYTQEETVRMMQQVQREHPDWPLERIREDVRKKIRFERAIEASRAKYGETSDETSGDKNPCA